MKIFYKNNGGGALLARAGGKLWTIRPGVNTVPDEVGAEFVAKYPKAISTDEEAIKAKSGVAAAEKKVLDLSAENAELKARIAKLELLAAEIPADTTVKDAEIAALKAENAELKEQLIQQEPAKRAPGRPKKTDSSTPSPAAE